MGGGEVAKLRYEKCDGSRHNRDGADSLQRTAVSTHSDRGLTESVCGLHAQRCLSLLCRRASQPSTPAVQIASWR